MACHLEPGTFFGKNRRSFRGPDFTLSDTLYRPEMHVPRHVHQLAYFAVLVEGGYWEQYRARRVDFGAPSVVFQSAHEVRRGDIGAAGARLLHVEIGAHWLARLPELGKVPDDALDCHGGPLVRLAARLHREFRADDAASTLILEGIVLEMLGEVVRAGARLDARPPRWLALTLERLRDAPAAPVRIADLAAEVDVNPVRLARAFRRHYGQTPGEFARRLRIERACLLLVKPEVSLAALAHQLGFADQSHFSRVFKQMVGVTPGRYRVAMLPRRSR